jgi:uncharacterized membrane protein
VAGIGFELRKLLVKDSLTGLFQAYAYASIISSGPWVLSIVGILIIGFMSVSVVTPEFLINQFQVTVTYLIALSLMLTGFVQLAFTRFIADRLFEKHDDEVLPNFNGVLLLVTLVSGTIAVVTIVVSFRDQSILYRLLLVSGFVIISALWVATILLSGLKQYKQIVGLYVFGYTISVSAALALRPFGLEGLLLGFVLGQLVMLMGMIVMVTRSYPGRQFIAFDFLKPGAMFPSLMMVGFLYNVGVWVDKFMFWFHPYTGQAVIGPLRASLIYDLPVFLAYLSIIPGMAVFLTRMETDFVEYYDRFYKAVRDGGALVHIEEMRDEMVFTIRQGIFEIIKIQAIATLVIFVAGPALLRWLGISELYLSLLYIDVVAAGLQVVFLGILNVFFYLDKRRIVLVLSAMFVVFNFVFTYVTLQLGAPFYGYGFALALLFTVMVGFYMLDYKLERLEYETFMLQR